MKMNHSKKEKIELPIDIVFISIILILLFIIIVKSNFFVKHKEIEISSNNINSQNTTEEKKNETKISKIKKDLGWNLTLVNSENKLPENYDIVLESIDQYRKFDSRAIEYLNNMILDMKNKGYKNIWVQSSYRSVELQKDLYNNKIKEYKRLGNNESEAKRLTEQVINKPGYSEHNLGLAVDFNYVKDNFKNTKEYKWLIDNAEDYGFILRYPKEKENITKVSYEPWHWRYVGIEDAKKINELGFCLEEYIEFLNN